MRVARGRGIGLARGAAAFALLATLCILAATSRAAPVTATIEPAQIAMGESAELTITSSGGNMEPLSLPPVPGLDFRVVGQSHRVDIINGATLASISLVVRVTPRQPGVYTIPGLTPKSEPLVLRVNPEGTPASTVPGQLGGGTHADGIKFSADGSAFIRLILPKHEIYVGESIPVEIEVGMRNGFVSSLNGLPTLTGGDFTLNNLSHQPDRVRKLVDGKDFTLLTWHSVLAGVKPGAFSLAVQSPLTVRIRTRPKGESSIEDMLGDPFLQNFFGATVPKDITVTSPATDLTVLPLPTEDRPADFSGAVGTFHLDAELSARSAAAGDPLTLKLRIGGAGNFDRVDTPMLDHVEGWKTYPPKSAFKAADTLGIKGEKTFEQPVIAARAGEQTLPAVSFSYFDPAARRYQTARSAALAVTVVPSLIDRSRNAPGIPGSTLASGGAAESADAVGLHPDHPPDTVHDSLLPLYLQPRFLVVPSTLALGVAGLWFARRRRGAARHARRRPTPTPRVLGDLEAAARAGNAAAFFALAHRALAGAEPDTGTTAAARSGELAELAALAEEANYAGYALDAREIDTWLRRVRERLLAAAAAALVLSVSLLGGFAPARAHADEPAANAPAAPLAPLAPAAPNSAAALYNLGNAYARAGQPALAIVNYQRARLLAPQDPDIDANLAAVRRSAHQPAEQPAPGVRALRAVDPTLAAWLGVIGVLAVGGALLAERVAPRRALRAVLGVAGCVLVAVPVGSAVALWPDLHGAVVVTNDAPVRASPAPLGEPLFTLGVAQSVRVVAQREDFLLIRNAAGRVGWVSGSDVVPVVPRPR